MSGTIDLINAKPCPDCRRMLTTEPKCCHCTERDQLRAELAAAKEEIQTWRLRHRDAMDTATRKVEQAEDVAAERDRLAADNARLRKALEWSKSYWPEREESRHCADCCCPTCDVNACIDEAEEALAATPAQSLAAHDAALLREVANKFEATGIDTETREPSESYDCGYKDGQYSAVNWLLAEADRIKKEAHHA